MPVMFISSPPSAAGGAVVDISNGSYSEIETGSARSLVKFNRDGTLVIDHAVAADETLSPWVTPTGSTVGDDYDIRINVTYTDRDPVFLVIDHFSNIAINTWTRVDTTLFFGWDFDEADAYGVAQVTVEVRPHGGGATLDTAIYTLTANSF
jgi:hypothetical protein